MLRLTPHNPEKIPPLIANAIMVSLLIFLLYQLGLQIYTAPKPSEDVLTTSDFNGEKTPQRQDKNRGKDIASMHLFGQALQEEPLPTKQKTNAPATKLNLTLRGIIAETEREQGHAIIQDNESSEEQFFKIGDLVFGLATLEEIYPDRVILLHNKKYETLFLPKEALSKKNISDYASIAAERKQAATDFRKAFLRGDGEELNTLFGFDTAYKSGGFVGFTVKSLGEKGQQMMEIFGVEDGDLITVIDG
ncbi:MAG: type II secretion system protein N, partial [Methylococcaceae bacterium]